MLIALLYLKTNLIFILSTTKEKNVKKGTKKKQAQKTFFTSPVLNYSNTKQTAIFAWKIAFFRTANHSVFCVVYSAFRVCALFEQAFTLT